MSDEVHKAVLTDLLGLLRALNYTFITPTPLTHARVVARPDKQVGRDLRDIFGWNIPFTPDAVGEQTYILYLLRGAGALEERDGLLKSTLRVSSLGADLFLHSAFPTTQQDAVFFGPDSYRFAQFIAAELPRFGAIHRLAEIGCGTGVGAVTALHAALDIAHMVLTDINQAALDLADINLSEACAWSQLETDSCDIRRTSALDGIEERIDCIIANPPYIIDPAHRAYRDGGGMHGAEISLTWAQAAAEKLAPGGALLLYTGSAIVNGEDRFKAALHEALRGFDINYRELDPDVFGEELEREDYADVERLAVVGVVAVKR